MKLYNTQSQQIEFFKPAGEDVTLYVCGITPYDTTHLGHAFTYTSADILIRYLEFQGHSVRYVQNVTDIDDDILRKANETGDDWRTLGNRWTVHYIRDMQALNVRPPTFFPRASGAIPEIIETVQALLTTGVAYKSGGNVYFHVDAWPEFGKLSHLPRGEMLPVANERGNHPDDPHKKDPLDFVLWQAKAPGEPSWESPWGPGRPGWHIECSSLVTRFLGPMIDIHGGGADLLFPHHECEIAQVEPLTEQKPFVRFWMHTAMVYHEEEKMSKSLGNLVMVQDLLQRWTPDALRLYLGQHHYRQTWSHSPQRLAQAAEQAKKFYQAVTVSGGESTVLSAASAKAAFRRAMDDDLDVPTALAVLDDLADQLLQAALDKQAIAAAQDDLRSMSRVFGLCLDAEGPETDVVSGWDRHLRQFEGG